MAACACGDGISGCQGHGSDAAHALIDQNVFARSLSQQSDVTQTIPSTGVADAGGRVAADQQMRCSSSVNRPAEHGLRAATCRQTNIAATGRSLRQAHNLNIASDLSIRQAHPGTRHVDDHADIASAGVLHVDVFGFDRIQGHAQLGAHDQFETANGLRSECVFAIGIGLQNTAEGRVKLYGIGFNLVNDGDVCCGIEFDPLIRTDADRICRIGVVSHRH